MAVLKARSYSFCHFDCSFQLFKGLEASKKLSWVGELSLAERLEGR